MKREELFDQLGALRTAKGALDLFRQRPWAKLTRPTLTGGAGGGITKSLCAIAERVNVGDLQAACVDM